ncbi:DNA-binding protein [Salinirubellus sp. GCM10025818]|uniref:DNA-binding protein n=1 Tax=Salinirubellus TaxID=2162630 RepID=UPI0030D0EA18
MPDDAAVRGALEEAAHAFRDTRGQDRETHLDPTTPAVTQLRKACRLLDACRVLQANNGYYTSVVELSFGAIERTIQYYALAKTTDTVDDFQDHETVFERGAELTLYSADTMEQLIDLWRTNRSAAYYGKFEAKASPFRAGMKPTNSIQPPTMA